jgi:hypothetical protein
MSWRRNSTSALSMEVFMDRVLVRGKAGPARPIRSTSNQMVGSEVRGQVAVSASEWRCVLPSDPVTSQTTVAMRVSPDPEWETAGGMAGFLNALRILGN